MLTVSISMGTRAGDGCGPPTMSEKTLGVSLMAGSPGCPVILH